MWGKWGGSNIGYRKLSSGLEPILLSIHMACVGCKNHILRHSHMTISGSPIDYILLSMFRYMVSQYPNKIPRAGEPQHSWDKDVRKNDIYRLHRYWSSNDGFSSVQRIRPFLTTGPCQVAPKGSKKNRCCGKVGRELSHRDFHSPGRSPNVPALRIYESLGQAMFITSV